MPAKYIVSGSGEGDILNLPQAAGIKVDSADQELKYIGTDGTVRRLKGSTDTAALEVKVFTAADTPASVAANTSQEESMTVTGVLATDKLLAVIAPGANPAGVVKGGARISANDTVLVEFINTTAGGLSPAAGTYTFVVAR